jgi:hypothetical protein
MQGCANALFIKKSLSSAGMPGRCFPTQSPYAASLALASIALNTWLGIRPFLSGAVALYSLSLPIFGDDEVLLLISPAFICKPTDSILCSVSIPYQQP